MNKRFPENINDHHGYLNDDDEGYSRFMDESLFGSQLGPDPTHHSGDFKGYRFINGKIVIIYPNTDKINNLKVKLTELVRRIRS